MKSKAAEFLSDLTRMRLERMRPVHGVIAVTTEEKDTELFREMKFATVEVWRRERASLDWSGVLGLSVYALIRWQSAPERLELFHRLIAGSPRALHWASMDGRGRLVGSVLMRDGVSVARSQSSWPMFWSAYRDADATTKRTMNEVQRHGWV